MKLEKDTNISHYKILSEIGKGGMGEVYLAQDTKLNRKVAIKILSDEFSKDADKLNRFVQEAQAASALNHPNIITIYEIGEFEDSNYIATEYIEGETLNKYLKGKEIKFGSVLDIAIQVASALDEAHSVGIVHRDIKPDNVMVRDNGLAKILDFGIAKLTEKPNPEIESEDKTAIQINTTPGMIIGTANYMSPEQAKGKEVDARTDIFSFGIVLYEMVAGSLPFDGETPIEMIGSILKDEPNPLDDIHPDLREIIWKSLKKNRDERYGNTAEVLTDLQDLKKRIEFEAELEKTIPRDSTSEAGTRIIKAVTDEEPSATVTASSRNSIAVMPFEHLSADEDNEYFCDGLAEELINALARINRLEVAARSSSFSFKGKNASASEISKVLNVRNILEGSVRKSGNRLRISVQLVNASDGYQIWSERYDREMKDIFDVQDEIALAVVEALKVKLLGGEKEAVLKRYTSNAEAYQLYLQGRFFFAKRTAAGFEKGIEHFKQAIEIDSEYAIAYSGLVDCYVILGFYELIPTEEAERLSVLLAQKALQIDDSIAEAWVSSGLSKFFSDFSESDAHYQKAISINPKYAAAYHFRATNLILMGRFQEGINSSKRAIELEPFSISFNAILAWWYYLSGRNDKAIKQSLKSIEIAPHSIAYWVLGLAFCRKQNFTKAILNMQTARELSGNSPIAIAELARIYAEAKEENKARDLLDELKQRSKSEYVSPTNFAKIYLGLGENQKAFEEIAKASEKRAFRLPYFLIDPMFKNYRSDPLIQDILRRLNMPLDENAKDTDDRLEAKTIVVEPKTTDGKKNLTTISPSNRKTKNDRSKMDWKIAGWISLFIVVAGILGYYFTANNSKQIESIAVMPFVNESGNKEVEYLSDGMTETLISSLIHIPNLSVKASSTVFSYKGKGYSAKRLGDELGVQAVLLGKVVQRGSDIVLRLELVDVSTEDILWGENYKRKMGDLANLQREIANNVSEKLKIRLSGEETQKLSEFYTVNPEAYQALLRGRYHWKNRERKGIEAAIKFFEKAIQLDPNYALAWSGIADSYSILPNYTTATTSKEAMPKARVAAEKAVSLGPNLAEAHTSLGMVLVVERKYEMAIAEYRKAIELNPRYATARHWLGSLLERTRQDKESIIQYEEGIRLEPLSVVINRNYADALFRMRKYRESEDQYKKVLEINPDAARALRRMGTLLAFMGKYDKAFAALNKSVSLEHEAAKIQLGIAYALSGNVQKAREIVETESKRDVHNPALLAELYAVLGEKDKAFELLDRSDGDVSTLGITMRSPTFDGLRGDTRFRQLMEKLGLPE